MRQRIREIACIARRILIELWRTRRTMVFWIVFPTLMLILFGLIYAGNDRVSRSFDWVAPGILIGAALFFSCLGGPVAVIVGERERRTLRRLLLTPVRPSSYMLGVVMAQLVVAFGQTAIVYGIAAAFGGSFHGSLSLGALIVLLSVSTFVGLGFFFGAHFSRSTEDVNGPVAAFGVPLLVLGGTFFSPKILPDFLWKLAHLDPVFHMNQALKPVSAKGAGAADIAVHLVLLVVFAAVALALGTHAYGVMLRRERRAS